MGDGQVKQLADAVAARLNGQLSSLRKDVGEIKGRLGKVDKDLSEVKVIVSATASKVDQLTEWYQDLDGRVSRTWRTADE